jgi:prepilin-type processing-associated H-X9-DG protein
MSKIVGIIFIVLVLLGIAGLILPAIYKARSEEELQRCKNHLRLVGTYGLFHSTMPGEPKAIEPQMFFPAGTVVNLSLDADKRMSFYVPVLTALDQGPEAGKIGTEVHHVAELMQQINVKEPWDSKTHQPIANSRVGILMCPSRLSEVHDQPAVTNYAGNGGLGLDTPALPLDIARTKAGLFRYDTQTPVDAIQDGLSNSLSLLESSNPGPWLQGGPSTVRGLNLEQMPYLGAGKQFGGNHPGIGNFSFADGSVRVLADRVSPSFFRALMTIKGGENSDDFEK